MADPVLLEMRDDVAWITLNHPERYNCFDGEMIRQVGEAVLESVDAVAIVITGAGEAFCAGGDLRVLARQDENEIRRLHYGTLRTFEEIRRSPRPVIAAVNGAAAGGGNELVAVCDLAIASDRATFGQSGPRHGSSPVNGGTNLLAIAIGEKRAKELTLLCRRYRADQALAMGLVNAVVPHDELTAEVGRWTAEIYALSPRFLSIAKSSTNLWWDFSSHDVLSGMEALMQTVDSYDIREGSLAFLEKRTPRFRTSPASSTSRLQ